MPNNTIKSLADESGKSQKSVEKMWDKAKKIADEQGRVKKSDNEDRYWAYVTGIVKNMLGLEDTSNKGSKNKS